MWEYVKKALLQEVQLNVGDEVSVSVENGRIIVEPATKVRGKYDLKELVSRIPQDYQAEELDWGKPVGKEVLLVSITPGAILPKRFRQVL